MCAVMVSVCAFADVPQPTDDFYVLDEADVLDIDTEGMIVFSNDLLFEDCGAQIVVVVVDTVGGDDIVDYSYELINDWKVGNEDGESFLLLLAIEDEDYCLMPGYGLDSVFTGGVLNRIMDDYLEPDFAAGNYDAAVDKTFRRVFEIVADECGSNATVADGIKLYEDYMASDDAGSSGSFAGNIGSGFGYEDPDDRHYEEERSGGGFGRLLVIIIVIVVIVLIVRSAVKRSPGPSGGHAAPRTSRRNVVNIFPFFHMPRTPAPPPPQPPRHPHGGQPPRAPRSGGSGFGGFGGTGSSGNKSGGSSALNSLFGGNRSGGSRSGFGTRSSGSSRSGFGGSRSGGGRSGFGGGRSGGGGGSRGGGASRGR